MSHIVPTPNCPLQPKEVYVDQVLMLMQVWTMNINQVRVFHTVQVDLRGIKKETTHYLMWILILNISNGKDYAAIDFQIVITWVNLMDLNKLMLLQFSGRRVMLGKQLMIGVSSRVLLVWAILTNIYINSSWRLRKGVDCKLYQSIKINIPINWIQLT